MRITVEELDPIKVRDELLVLEHYESELQLDNKISAVDQHLNHALSDLIRSGEFKARLGQTYIIPSLGQLPAKRIALVGLGKRAELSYEAVRSASGSIMKTARELSLTSVTASLLGAYSKLAGTRLASSMVEGAELSMYSFNRYKTSSEQSKPPDNLRILARKGEAKALQQLCEQAQIVCEGVKLSRDLANTPSNDCPPSHLADTAKKSALKHGFQVRVLERAQLEKMGFGGLLAVSRGSQQPPRFIIMDYNPRRTRTPDVILVGKAVTFDSGGISLKPGDKMDEMKYDKSGGATVIAAVTTAAALKLPVHVMGLIPSCENLPSGSAYRPGDVIRIHGGKTAEVLNTDAEGRLILADALSYACSLKPQAIIDLATLTGACVVALGAFTSGLFGNNAPLKERVKEAAEASGERVWELPLWPEFYEQVKGKVGDVKNSAGRTGGAITAAAFLGSFVDNTPWAHLDIAGTAWDQEGSLEKSYNPKGATGVGVRLLTQLLSNWKKPGKQTRKR